MKNYVTKIQFMYCNREEKHQHQNHVNIVTTIPFLTAFKTNY